MTITSVGFFAFLLLGMAVYYIVPRRGQWMVLLLLSVLFYLFAATPYTILYLILSTVLAYGSTMLMERGREKRAVLWVTMACVAANILIWFLLKGNDFWSVGFYVLHRIWPQIPYVRALPGAAALGMGYYTAQVVGYIVDCYWGTVTPQKNPLKLFLFVIFFPQLTVGPISTYESLQPLYESHSFRYENLCFGFQRILWGLFKKLVIADRLGMIIAAIWNGGEACEGYYIWAAVLLYPIQIYGDFSGCMDIVLGTAELFDIRLAENFNNPFYALSSQEFWQRWHMTLGQWAKTYVYYPVLKSRPLQKVGKWAKKHFAKKTAKRIPWALGTAVLWLVMGFWHGGLHYILGISLWYWCIFVLSEFSSPVFPRLKRIFGVREDSFSWRLFQRIRTYLLFSLGVLAFSASGMSEALGRIGRLIASFGELNPWVFFDSSLFTLGITWHDIWILLLGFVLLAVVAHLRESYGYARVWMQKQWLPFRWFIWLGLFLLVLVYGKYGPGYSAAEFIYQGF